MPTSENSIAPANTTRYTWDGDTEVEGRIGRDQQLIGNAVQQFLRDVDFRALVLIGGYGRGEGGFCYRDGKPSPYNDYDYFVVVRDMDKSEQKILTPKLRDLAKKLEHEVGVEVDFFFLREEALPGLEFSLMFAEMQWGHRVVVGDQDVLKWMPIMPIERLALGEFTRLMLNRGSLLLMNKQALVAGGPADDMCREIFVKYLFKAVLASGDAYLAAANHYHPSYPEKYLRLQSLPEDEGISALLQFYQLALDARFHPDYHQYLSRDMQSWQTQVTAIWLSAFARLESTRLEYPVVDWQQYAASRVTKGQSGNGFLSMLRNAAVTMRDYGLFEVLGNPGRSLRYPRERLISILPLMLQADATNAVHARISDALGLTEASWNQAAESYIVQWHRYS